MSKTIKIIKEITSTGFGSNSNNLNERLIYKEGDITIKKVGLKFIQRSNLYHLFINMSATFFFLWLLAVFIIINLFFTGI